MAFVQNNIRFRSVSSKALEYFYGSKAFMLNELILERNQFSEVARETLLLLFNSFSSWATEVEYLFLRRNIVTEDDVAILQERLDRVNATHLNIFDVHSELFTRRFIQVWLEVNKGTSEAFAHQMNKAVGLSNMEAYPLIIGSLVNFLQSTLFELYEVDCLLGSNFVVEQCTNNRSNTNKAVVYVDNFAFDYYKETGKFLLLERLRYYRSMACVPIPLLVKNYTAAVVNLVNGKIEGDKPLADLLRQLQDEEMIILEIVSSAAEHKSQNR